MKHDQLLEFCSHYRDEPREWLLKPFRWNGFDYASDGNIFVRTAANEMNYGPPIVSSTKTSKNMGQRMDELITEAWSVLRPIPDWDRELLDFDECDSCDGHGWNYQIEFDSREEVKVMCDRCEGEGRNRIRNEIEVGACVVDSYYLRLMESLPNAQIAYPTSDDMRGIMFSFDGGVGVVMPMRRSCVAKYA